MLQHYAKNETCLVPYNNPSKIKPSDYNIKPAK